MEQSLGIMMVLAAGLMQGTFVLPMTLVKNWKWEHIWLIFSVLGMVGLNLLLAFIFVTDLHLVYSEVASEDIIILALFGLGWGVGSVLFGIGMEKLGMSIGYPIIMGLTASMGGLIPLFILYTSEIFKPSGLIMISGTLLVILGIVFCSKAASARIGSSSENSTKSNLTNGIIIAVLAGFLSSLPNIGFSFGTAVTQKALSMGTSEAMAGNAVWALFFTAGFLPNLFYTVYLIIKNRNAKAFLTQYPSRNFLLGFLMAGMWIGSFYLYGISSVKLGSWGNIVGWPVFISLSIVVGNLWGIWKGEWKNAKKTARQKLNRGLVILIIAMAVIGLSNIF